MADRHTAEHPSPASEVDLPLLLRHGRPWGDETPDVETADHLEYHLPFDERSQRSVGVWAKGHEYTWLSTGKNDKRERRYDPR